MTTDALSDQQLLCEVCAAAIWMTVHFKSNSSTVKGHSLGPKFKSRCKNYLRGSGPCKTGIFPTREKARAAWDKLKKGEADAVLSR